MRARVIVSVILVLILGVLGLPGRAPAHIRRFAYAQDLSVLHRDRAVLDHIAVPVHRDDRAAEDEKIQGGRAGTAPSLRHKRCQQ